MHALTSIRTYLSNRVSSVKMPVYLMYILSFFVVLLIPVLILSVIVFHFIFDAFEQELIEHNSISLEQVKSNVDVKFDDLKRIVYQVFYEPEVAYYAKWPNPLKGREVIQTLKDAIFANSFIRDVILFTDESNYLLASTGSYSITHFINQIYHYQDWSEEQFIQDLQTSKLMYHRPAENVEIIGLPQRLITAVYPDRTENKTLLFLINEQTVLSSLGNPKGSIAIFDSEGQLITATPEAKNLNIEPLFPSQPSGQAFGHTTVIIDEVEYLLSYTTSESTMWTYVSLLPINEALSKLASIKQFFMLALLATFLISTTIIAGFTRYNYKPIQQLKRFAETRYGNRLPFTNELDAVKFTIDHIAQTNSDLEERIKTNHPALKDFVLTSFLKGNYMDIQAFNRAAEAIGIRFTKPHYFIVLIHLHAFDEYRPNMDDLCHELEHSLPPEVEGYCKINMEHSKLVMILSIDQSDHKIESYLELLMNYLTLQWDIRSTFGVSNRSDEVASMWKSYLEASTALEHRFVKGNQQILLFNDLPVNENEYKVNLSKSLDSLSLSMKNGDFTRVNEHIEEFFRLLRESTSLFMVRCGCFDIINTIMRTIYDMNKPLLVNDQENFDLNALTQYDTVEELAVAVKSFCHDVCEYVQSMKQDTENDLRNSIKTYIDEHCCDLDFSVQTTAELFDMSAYTLRHHFKSYTGITISEYVSARQIEKAKHLLITSDESIQSIVQQVGHYDSSNFIRKFKQNVGLTPGEYRKQQK